MEEKKEEKHKEMNIKKLIGSIILILLICSVMSYRIYRNFDRDLIEDKSFTQRDFMAWSLTPLIVFLGYLIICLFLIFGELRRRKTEKNNWITNLREKILKDMSREETAQEIIDEADNEDHFSDFRHAILLFLSLVVFTIMFFGALSVKYPYESNFMDNVDSSFIHAWNTAGSGIVSLFHSSYNIGVNNHNFFYYFYFFFFFLFIWWGFIGDYIRHKYKFLKSLFKKLKGGKDKK